MKAWHQICLQLKYVIVPDRSGVVARDSRDQRCDIFGDVCILYHFGSCVQTGTGHNVSVNLDGEVLQQVHQNDNPAAGHTSEPCPTSKSDRFQISRWYVSRYRGMDGNRFELEIHLHKARNVPAASGLFVVHREALRAQIRTTVVRANEVDVVLIQDDRAGLRTNPIAPRAASTVSFGL